jgi:hypothetical protein
MSGVFVVADENAAAGRRKDRDRVDEFDAGLGTGSERTAWIFSEVVNRSQIILAWKIRDTVVSVEFALWNAANRAHPSKKVRGSRTSGHEQCRGPGGKE